MRVRSELVCGDGANSYAETERTCIERRSELVYSEEMVGQPGIWSSSRLIWCQLVGPNNKTAPGFYEPGLFYLEAKPDPRFC